MVTVTLFRLVDAWDTPAGSGDWGMPGSRQAAMGDAHDGFDSPQRRCRLAWALAVLGLLVLTPAALAHEDLVLDVSAEGAIGGLPQAYRPARVRVAFAQQGKEGLPSEVVLDLPGGRSELPSCVIDLFVDAGTVVFQVYASWSIDSEVLPPYLGLHLFRPGQDPYTSSDGYHVLYRLEDTQLLSIQRHRTTWFGSRHRQEDVEFEGRCSDEELARLRFVAPRLD